MKQAAAIQFALEELERMPGIGPKSAQRILHWILSSDKESAERLAQAISELKQSIHFCKRCYNYAEDELCVICSDPSRDQHSICVVAEPRDINAIERSGSYTGLYHVLGGVINPIEGCMPDDLYIAALMKRLASEDITEVLIATNPDTEGEATATYLARLIKTLNIKVTRPASGLPVGGELEYADELTLGRAIESRHEL